MLLVSWISFRHVSKSNKCAESQKPPNNNTAAAVPARAAVAIARTAKMVSVVKQKNLHEPRSIRITFPLIIYKFRTSERNTDVTCFAVGVFVGNFFVSLTLARSSLLLFDLCWSACFVSCHFVCKCVYVCLCRL